MIPARSLSLKRLIANLINNAKALWGRTHRTVCQSCRQYILITVADHGEGIPPDHWRTDATFCTWQFARTIQGSGLVCHCETDCGHPSGTDQHPQPRARRSEVVISPAYSHN